MIFPKNLIAQISLSSLKARSNTNNLCITLRDLQHMGQTGTAKNHLLSESHLSTADLRAWCFLIKGHCNFTSYLIKLQ